MFKLTNILETEVLGVGGDTMDNRKTLFFFLILSPEHSFVQLIECLEAFRLFNYGTPN